jgi:hypothetical protein
MKQPAAIALSGTFKLLNPCICRFKLWNVVRAKKQAEYKNNRIFITCPGDAKFGQICGTDGYDSLKSRDKQCRRALCSHVPAPAGLVFCLVFVVVLRVS